MPCAGQPRVPVPTDLALNPTVVLVHGLWNPRWTLSPLARRLAKSGFRPLPFAWDTTRAPFEESARALCRFIEGQPEPLHLVGHSLGGLLVRSLLHHHPREVPPGRVVTLGSPHGGSRTARVAARFRTLRRMNGLAVAELVAGVPAGWPPPDREVGTVAGTLSLGLGRLFPGLEKPNDGVVTVEETQLPGAASRAVHISHTQLLFSPTVARLVAGFLEDGAFPE